MTTIAAPQSVTFTSTIPNGFISVDCSAGGEMLVTWVSPGSISGQRSVKGNAEDIGPFADQTVITLRALSGSPEYTDPLGGAGLTTSQVEALAATMPVFGGISSAGLTSVAEAVRIGWRMSASAVQSPSEYVAKSPLIALFRSVFEYNRALLNPMLNWQANIGTVVYVDPQALTNGTGVTHTSPRNILPGFADNQTILLAENSVHPSISMGARTNWLIGTYDRRTGKRVFDPSRLAIVEGGGVTALNFSGAHVNTWVSGIKVRNFRTGILKGRNAGASGGGVEFCVNGGAQVTFAGMIFVQNFIRGATIRFNVSHGDEVDGLWHGECLNTTGDTLIYGNDISLAAGSLDGPDSLQFNFLANEACGAVTVHTNFLDNSRSNRKQIIIGAYAGPKQAGDSLNLYNNVCLGVDTSLPMIASAVSQNGIYINMPNANIHENIVVNSRYPIVLQHGTPSVVDGGRIVGNLVVIDTPGKIAAAIEATGSVAGPQMVIEKNTIIGINCGGLDSGAGNPVAIKSYAAASIKSNVILGTFWLNGIRVKAADAGGQLVTSNNAFDSRMEAFYFDNGAGARATDATDWTGVENWIDAWFRPLLGSPLETGGAAWPGGAVPDVYRHAAIGIDGIGALHPAREA